MNKIGRRAEKILIFPPVFWHLQTRMSRNRGSSQLIRAFDLKGYLARRAAAVDRALHVLLPPANTKPATIHKAMRYSLFAGGKRLRPALCLAAAEACGGAIAQAMPLACAVECIHTYSLIHDDLPAMDDDDLRRGQPTNHKVFGEGIAILAGDGLLTEAFAIAARCRGWPRYPLRAIIRELAEAAGSRQLIAGQVADLEGEGRKLSAVQLKYIHERKTSALLCGSVRLGGMSANASAPQLRALTAFGYNVGLAFQIIDDILDVTQTSEQLGKTAGKDTTAEKATYPSIVGMEKSRAIAAQLTGRAFRALEFFKGQAGPLAALAEHLLRRDK
jgi:geranylgeranyl diphosphate synthase type II